MTGTSHTGALASPSTSRNLMHRAYDGICRYWLPMGFFLFLVGLFIMPARHEYKLLMNYMLLLPALLCVAFIPGWWRSGRRDGGGVLLALLGSYFVYMGGSAAYRNPDEGTEFLQWSFYIALLLIGVGLCMQISTRRLVLLLWSATCVAAAAALYAVVHDAWTGVLFRDGYRLQGYGALYNPLRSGHLWGVFCWIGIGLSLANGLPRLQRWLAAGCAAIIFVAVLLTGSRSPLFALFATGLGWALFMAPAQQRRPALVFIFVVAAVALGVFWSSLLERGFSLRPELWGLVLTKIAEQPWFGAGLATQLTLYASDGRTYLDTHNVFLAVLYYGGIVGLMLFLALFGYAFYLAWRERNKSSLCALAAPLQAFGIFTLQFDGGSLIGRPTEFWLLYWLPMALTLFALRESSRRAWSQA